LRGNAGCDEREASCGKRGRCFLLHATLRI